MDIPYRILIVDDDKINLDLVVRILEIGGYKVFPAGKWLGSPDPGGCEVPDLITLDMLIPTMDGYELFTRL